MHLKDKSKGILKILTVFSLCALFFVVYKADAETIFPAGSSSGAHFFNRDLKLGDSGEDVRELQKVLNSNAGTVVANDGPGSAGNETEYFGTLTKWAVISFQEEYRSEILTPGGLSAGTGFVGPATRAKLNSLSQALGGSAGGALNSASGSGLSSSVGSNILSSNSGIPSLTPAAQTAFMQSLFPQKISMLNVSKYQVSPGSSILISGSGFSNSPNTGADGIFLHIGDGRSVPLTLSSTPPAAQGMSLMTATIPSDLATGKYEVWVTKGENGTGAASSKNSSIPFFILVTNNPHEAPAVSSITPPLADSSGQITITGTGFTSTGNNIYSTLGNILNVSASGGGTIVIRISDFPATANVKKAPGAQSLEVDGWLYIQNENGVNASPAPFKVKF